MSVNGVDRGSFSSAVLLTAGERQNEAEKSDAQRAVQQPPTGVGDAVVVERQLSDNSPTPEARAQKVQQLKELVQTQGPAGYLNTVKTDDIAAAVAKELLI